MKNLVLSTAILAASFFAHANPIGETANYILDSGDRTSWMIKEGAGKAFVTEFRNDPKIGPAYVVNIEYDLKVKFKGRQQGTIGLLVPATMFEDQFYVDLADTHPVDMGAFKVDYIGTSIAHDNNNTAYNQCQHIRLFDIDPNYQPVSASPSVSILWHITSGPAFENLVLNIKKHDTVPVIGAVEFDLAGKVFGFDIKAGFDYAPPRRRN